MAIMCLGNARPIHWQCLSLRHLNSVSISPHSNSDVLLPVSCNVSCLKHLNDVSVWSCLSLVLNVLVHLAYVFTRVSWRMSLTPWQPLSGGCRARADCTADEYRCVTMFSCIPATSSCDGTPNCDIGEDENCFGERQLHRRRR